VVNDLRNKQHKLDSPFLPRPGDNDGSRETSYAGAKLHYQLPIEKKGMGKIRL